MSPARARVGRAVAAACLVALALASCGDRNDGAGVGLSVVTFNVLHGLIDEDPSAEPFDRFPERLPLIAGELARRQPDVIMLQETAEIDAAGYPDVIAVLLDELNHGAAAPYHAIFGTFDGSRLSTDGGMGLGQTTLSRLPVLASTVHRVVSVPGGSPRSVVHVRVVTGLGEIDFYNAHLQGPNDARDAATEMQDVVDFIAATTGPEGNAILGGDLNSPETAPVYQVLRDAGFVELGAAAGLRCTASDNSGCTNETFPLDEPGNRTSIRLDYLWVRSRVALVPKQVGLIFGEPFALPSGGVLWASDHRGLAAKF